MQYLVDGHEYGLDYQALREQYLTFKEMDDAVFIKNASKILHFACIVSYLKGLGIEATLSDKGIIHELVHLIELPDEPLTDIQEIRESFNRLLELS